MRAYTIIGHIFFAILAILATYFYAERTIFIDSAFQIFKIVNFETWNVEAGRYSAVISQILPLIFIKAGASLPQVLWAYSLSFILLFYLVFCLATYKLKSEVAGITIVFLLCLCIRQSFYHVATETHQGLVYSVLLYAWLSYSFNSTTSTLRYTIAVLLVLLCYFSHPVTLIPILFIFAYHAIDKNLIKNKNLYLLSALTIALYSFKFFATPEDSYEGDQFQQLGNFIQLMPNILSFSSTIFFAGNVNNLYYLPLLLLLVVLIFYLKEKNYFKFWLVGGAVFMFMLITLITYHRGDSIVMMEKNFMPLTILIIIPLANDILSNTKTKHKMKVGLVSLSVAIGLIGIVLTGNLFSQRLDYIDGLKYVDNQKPTSKTLVMNDDLNIDLVMVTWTIAIETLLYSSLDTINGSSTTYVASDKSEVSAVLNDPELFLATPKWRDWKISELNNKYFKLGRTTYQVLTDKSSQIYRSPSTI